ncbi:MAG: T9SS type A sorting domain-containing protein, partial [Bacteroidota bacterium]
FGPNGAWWLGNERSVYRYLDGELLRLPEIPIFEQDDVTIKSIYPFASDDVWVTFGTLEISFAHFNGQSWSLFRSEDYDLPLTNVQSIVKEPHSNTYWASGLDGLFKITRGSGSLPAPPARMRSFNVFPNPACCTFSVEWEQNAGEVIISLHNVLGQPVRELLRRSTAAGTFRQTFSRHGLESGIYFLQIKEGDRTKTIPLIIH